MRARIVFTSLHPELSLFFLSLYLPPPPSPGTRPSTIYPVHGCCCWLSLAHYYFWGEEGEATQTTTHAGAGLIHEPERRFAQRHDAISGYGGDIVALHGVGRAGAGFPRGDHAVSGSEDEPPRGSRQGKATG